MIKNENNNSYYIDYHFIEQRGPLNSRNWLEYLQGHPEYESNCLNQKYRAMGYETIEISEILKNGDVGIFYQLVTLKHNYLVIKKYLIDNDKELLVRLYYCYENKIFSSANCKNLLFSKLGNLSSILNKFSKDALQ